MKVSIMSQIPNTIETAIAKMIQEHFDLDENLEQVIWIKSATTQEIRLIQITADTLPTGDVKSFYFGPSGEIPCPLLIAQITPEEWQKVLQREIPLPEDWSLEDYKIFSREVITA